MDRFFVITGGPGSGKSTLLAALAEQGLPHMPEAGRAVIRDEVAAGGAALPWDDRDAFAERMLAHEPVTQDAASPNSHDTRGPALGEYHGKLTGRFGVQRMVEYPLGT